MGKEIKKNNNGFVGFLENLLLAKSVRHGFLLYFIIFNLDLILTLLGKGHIVKDLARIIPGIFFGTIETSLIENCVYKGPIYNAENVSTWWRFGKPLLFGFGVPIGFDVIQRASVKIRIWIAEKWVDITSLNIENDKLLTKQIDDLKTEINNNSDFVYNRTIEVFNIIIKISTNDQLCIFDENEKDKLISLYSINKENINSVIQSFLRRSNIYKDWERFHPFLESVKDYPFTTTHP
jgi:hypothetical protein